MLERDDHRHQLRDRRDRNAAPGVVGEEHLAGHGVLDEPGAGVGRRRRLRSPSRRAGTPRSPRARRAALSSQVELLADEERRRRDLRVQRHEPVERDPGAGRDRAEGVPGANDVDALRGGRVRPRGACASPLRASEARSCGRRRSGPAAARPRAVAASRKAIGPGVEPPAATAGDGYQPETFHISFFSRAASAPAAARKSSPESRKA